MKEYMSSAPAVAERALMLDIGRKYYTPGWIKRMIGEIAGLGMNAIVLHFSEEMGLGIESRLFPWLNGRDGSLCVLADVASDRSQITQEEVGEIVAFAGKLGVTVIPSFDTPGHMNYIVKRFNEYAASRAFTFVSEGKEYSVPQGKTIDNRYHHNGRTAVVQGSRNTAFSRGIDVSDPIAVAFTKALLGEYAALFASFGCDRIDIGGDELLGWGGSLSDKLPKWKQLDHWQAAARVRTGLPGAVAYDLLVSYMNEMAAFVRTFGYRSVRMWNDDAYRSADTGWSTDASKHIQLDREIEILYWSATANRSKNTLWTYANQKKVYNYLCNYNYFVLGKGAYGMTTVENLLGVWSPYVFTADGSPVGCGGNATPGDKLIGGTAFCVWCDNPLAMTEEEVADAIRPLLAAHAERAWRGK